MHKSSVIHSKQGFSFSFLLLLLLLLFLFRLHEMPKLIHDADNYLARLGNAEAILASFMHS
jgi:hypothetical protein